MAPKDDRNWGRSLVSRKEVVDHPWLASATTLLKILSAPTPEEFDRRSVKFSQAYREFRNAMMANRQDPDRNGRQIFRDPDFGTVLEQLNGAAMEAKCGDPVSDPEGFSRRAAIVNKVVDLMMKTVWTPE